MGRRSPVPDSFCFASCPRCKRAVAAGGAWRCRCSRWLRRSAFAAQLGYFLARDPCVQFLYILVGIKFIESRNTRDGTLLICLALFLAVTQFFYTQTIVAAIIALPALFALGGSLAVLRVAIRSARPVVGATGDARPPDAAGHSARRTAVRAVSAPRRAAMGLARRCRRAHRAVGSYVARRDQRAIPIRCGSFPSRLSWTAPSSARPLLARSGVRAFQRSGVERLISACRPADSRSARAPPIDYTVTLEPHGKLWLFALEHAAGLPRPPTDDIIGAGAINDIAFLTYDQQLLARTTVTQTVRYVQRSVLRGSVLPVAGDATDNLQLPPQQSRTASFARDLRARSIPIRPISLRS